MQVLSKRLDALGCEYRALAAPMSADGLVGDAAQRACDRPCDPRAHRWDIRAGVARLPGLAVIVCTGPSSVAQRVRGLRLGADAWITKPFIPRS